MNMPPNGLNILTGKLHPFWPMNMLVPWLRKHTADYRLTAQCFTWFKWSIVFFLCLAWLFYVDFSFAILSSWFLLPRGIIELASPSNIDICWRVANFYDSLTCDICICWLDISVLILSFFLLLVLWLCWLFCYHLNEIRCVNRQNFYACFNCRFIWFVASNPADWAWWFAAMLKMLIFTPPVQPQLLCDLDNRCSNSFNHCFEYDAGGHRHLD